MKYNTLDIKKHVMLNLSVDIIDMINNNIKESKETVSGYLSRLVEEKNSPKAKLNDLEFRLSDLMLMYKSKKEMGDDILKSFTKKLNKSLYDEEQKFRLQKNLLLNQMKKIKNNIKDESINHEIQ